MPATRAEPSLSDALAPRSVCVIRPPSRSMKDESKHDFSKAKEFRNPELANASGAVVLFV
jgi:hypothetical protein